MMGVATILKKRDAEAIPHLEQYAPVWLFDDNPVIFNVVFQHSLYGWVKRRYRYEGFGNVLYYLDETTISEDEALTIESQQESYINPVVTDFVNAYAG